MTASLKTCPYCAEEIAAEAIKCKHCGTVLEARPDASGPVFDYPPATLTIPMLVSAGWNIVTALVWSVALPCLGFVVALPYAALALFEILTFQKAPTMTPRQLYDRCGWLGGIQIFLGLTNLVPVIAGSFCSRFATACSNITRWQPERARRTESGRFLRGAALRCYAGHTDVTPAQAVGEPMSEEVNVTGVSALSSW